MAGGIFVTATSTNVGKTVVSSLLCKKLSISKERVCYYKPVQTGCHHIDGRVVIPDVEFVKEVNKDNYNACYFTTYNFQKPASPHLSSALENTEISLDKIYEDYKKIDNNKSLIITEGAGGLFVPLNKNGALVSDIPKVLNIPVVLISNAGLGAINSVGLSFFYILSNKIKLSSIILLYDGNCPTDIEIDNHSTLKKILKFEAIYLLPSVKNCDTEKKTKGNIDEVLSKYPGIEEIKRWFSE